MSDAPIFSKEDAESMTRNAVIRMEVEGCWIAICECGQECGVALLEPDYDARTYVCCRVCSKQGDKDGIRWVRQED
jgi:hypothetical protein